MRSAKRLAEAFRLRAGKALMRSGAAPGQRVLLAVSGGADSMVMLDALAARAGYLGIGLCVAHFDHRLRGPQAGRLEREFVRRQAAIRNLPCQCGGADVRQYARQSGRSVEDAARQRRYDFLMRAARQNACTHIATAHNANDNAETLLLNLIRGSGPAGLAGIPAVSQRGNVTLIRPLLDVPRSDIEQYAGAAGVEFITDPTNDSADFRRNRVRHQLLPYLQTLNPGIVDTLCQTAHVMARVDDLLCQAAMPLVNAQYGPVLAPVKELAALPPAVASQAVRLRLAAMHPALANCDYRMVQRALALCHAVTGTKADLHAGLRLMRDRQNIVLLPLPDNDAADGVRCRIGGRARLPEHLVITRVVRLRPELVPPGVLYLDAGLIASEYLWLRCWHAGDRFRPFGMKQLKKVSDYLTDKKVPARHKPHIPVLTDGDTIVCLPGLQIDDRYRVGQHTTRVLRVEHRRTAG